MLAALLRTCLSVLVLILTLVLSPGSFLVSAAPIPGSTAPQHQQIHQQVQNNTARLQQLEQANQDALARNQELQLMNDNLTVQVQVLQSERSAQMFLYGAITLGVGALVGFILANYMLGKQKRRW